MDQENENKKEIDLSEALKGSDGSDTDAKPQEEQQRPEEVFLPGTPKVIQWVIKYSGGLIKDEKQASYALIGFVAVAIIISLFLVFGSGGGAPGSKKPDIETFKNAPPEMAPRK